MCFRAGRIYWNAQRTVIGTFDSTSCETSMFLSLIGDALYRSEEEYHETH